MLGYALSLLLLLNPVAYQPLGCERAAKDFYKEYGGDVVFANPLNEKGYVLGDYAGHWLNSKVVDGELWYFDVQKEKIMNQSELRYVLEHRIFGMKFEMWIVTQGEHPKFKVIEREMPCFAN